MNAFTRGYTAAAAASVGKSAPDLAPATLDAMVKDCAAFVTFTEQTCVVAGYANSEREGRWFWETRQRGNWTGEGWAPLTLSVGDGGLVSAKEAGR